MAQYRAIFQNAYFKGLATAAVVTMGLAAGQAQAAETVTDQTTWEALEGHELTGTIAVSGDTAAVTAKNTKAGGFTLSLTGADNKIQGTGNAVSLTAENGTLKLATNGSKLAVGTGTGDSGTTLNIKAFDIQEGTITVANTKDKTTTVTVKNVTVGEKGVLDLTGGADSGADTNLKFGDSATTYNLTSGSTVNLTKANWEGDISNASDANITIKDDSTIKNYGTNVKANITVEAQKTGTIALVDNADTADKDEGLLKLASGSTISISGDGTSGSTLKLSSGNLSLDEGVILSNTSSDETDAGKAGTLTIGDTTAATLTITKDTLSNFLSGTNDGAKKGVLDISASGTVIVNGDISLSEFAFSGTAGAGKIKVADGAQFGANNIVIDATAADAATLKVIAKDTLTLGSSSADTVDAGVKSLEAKSLATVTSGTEFKLQDDVTLSSTQKQNGILVGDSGSITGSAINLSGGKLAVKAGTYEFANNLTITSGSLAVSSSIDADGAAGSGTDTVASKLTLTGDIVLKNESNNGISVSGANAVLDLSNASSLTTSKADNTEADIAIAAQDGATLIMNGEQVTGFVGAVNGSASSKVASITLSKDGILSVTDSLEITAASLKSGNTATAPSTTGQIMFDSATNSGGILQVAGTLTLTDINTDAVAIGEHGKITANTIKLEQLSTSQENAVKLGAGQYKVLSSLESKKEINLSDANSKLFLGAVDTKDGVSTPLSTTGKITADLNVATGAASVVAGDWTAQKNVTAAASTKLNIGDSNLKDANNDPIHAKLNVAGLLSANASTVTVNTGSELVVNAIAASGTAAITMNGDMTINGKFDSGAKLDDASDDTYGVTLEKGAIVLGNGSNLTITGAATQGMQLSESGDLTFATDVDTNFADGAVTSKAGSNVDLVFAEQGVINKTGLDALSKKLFGDGTTPYGTVTLSSNVSISGIVVDEENKTVAWKDNADGFINYLPTYVDQNLLDKKLTQVADTPIAGHFGSVVTDLIINEGDTVTFTKGGGLYNAVAKVEGSADKYFALGKDGVVLGVTLEDNTNFVLANGGIVDHAKIGASSSLTIDGVNAQTKVLKDITSTDATGSLNLQSGETNVAGKVKVGYLTSKAGASLTTNTLELTSADKSSFIDGNVTVADATKLAGSTTFTGDNTFGGAFTATKDVNFDGGNTVFAEGKNVKVGNLSVLSDGSVDVKGVLQLSAKTGKISVGESLDEVAQTEGTTGTLTVERLDLAGGSLVVDPEFTKASSFAGVNQFGPNAVSKADEAGIVNGNVYALQNAIVAVGTKDEAAVKSVFAKFVEADGSLQDPTVKGNENGVGAIAYVAKKFELADGSKLVVDPSATDKTYAQKTYSGDIFVGSNSALAIDVSALADDTKAAITLGKNTNATVYVQDNEKSKMYITGSLSDIKGEINLFDTKNGTGTVTLTLGTGEKFRVQTINGLFYKEFANGDNLATNITELDFNNIEADKQFSVVSEPVKNTLMSLGYGYNDYELPSTERKDLILGHRAEGYYVNDQGKFFTTADFQPDSEVSQLDVDKLGLVSETIDGKVVAYYKDNNALLNNILVNGGNAVDAETVARLAVFGGAPQAAIEAGASTYEAISARMGVGVSGVSAAANGQGGAIWVTPVYKSADSDGFNADNKSYGADVKLYGLALGADIEVAPNFKVGGMFNVGSGDADGQGLGANVSNDFDYYGLGLYAGYSMDAFSLVADVTYTAVDNDIEGNTDLGKVNASIDSTNLSVGVTGQYKLSVAGMDVTPHAGVRFSKLDIDDYTTEYAQSSSDSLNIFSVPVGVTIAKEYVTDTWTVKPSFDLTLTGNFGDDEFEGNAQWATFSNLSTNVKSEIMDNFTYGAAVGVSATTGNFGLGLGVNYTGSSNTDEFGVNANARYMF